MKKILICLCLLLMMFACDSNEPVNDPIVDPIPASDPDKKDDDKEIVVACSDVIKKIAGRYVCPVQNYDIVLRFYEKDGRFLVDMNKLYYSNDTDNYMTAELFSATYNKENKTYTLNLDEYGVPLKYDTLKVDVSKLDTNEITASNVYDDNKMVPYLLTEEESSGPNGAPDLEHTVWKLKDPDVSDMYLPMIEFDSAGFFVMTENLYEGMGQLMGGYSITEKGYECFVDSTNNMTGFMGADTEKIVFTKLDDTCIRLENDVCYSRAGALFYIVP